MSADQGSRLDSNPEFAVAIIGEAACPRPTLAKFRAKDWEWPIGHEQPIEPLERATSHGVAFLSSSPPYPCLLGRPSGVA